MPEASNRDSPLMTEGNDKHLPAKPIKTIHQNQESKASPQKILKLM
jgi:hypothetical protein